MALRRIVSSSRGVRVIQLVRRQRVRFGDMSQQFLPVLAGKCWLQRDELVERHSQGIDIRAAVETRRSPDACSGLMYRSVPARRRSSWGL